MSVRKTNAICLARPRSERLGDGRLLVRAPAKVNLTLAITGVRADGYHLLDSVVSKISLYDELVFSPGAEIELACRSADGAPMDCGPVEKNLAVRAAELLPRRAGQGVRIELVKAIRPGAGLGGGSSDAAAALWALNQWWELGLPTAELARLGLQLGADVPLFLGGPHQRMSGVGEQLSPAEVGAFWAVLVMPDFGCPTREVYAAYDAVLRQEADAVAAAPGPSRRPAAARFAGPPSRWSDGLFNDLLSAALAVRPELGQLAGRISAATGAQVHMSGSGSGLFVLADSRDEAVSLAEALLPEAKGCCVVQSNPW